MYAEVAPLPIPLAAHLFQHMKIKDPRCTDSLFLQEIAEKRQYTYLYMDSFVRNRDHSSSPRHLRFSTQWTRTTLGRYSPTKKPIPSKTFNHWLSNGMLRSERKGQPTPDSVAAIIILRMIIEGKRLLPSGMAKDEAPWWCYAQQTKESPIQCIPITAISDLPSQTLLWTSWPGASWDPSWHLVGKNLGAIRFAGVQSRQGHLEYMVSMDDIFTWKPEYASIGWQEVFTRDEFHEDEVQAMAHLALAQLARERIHTLG
jgi:hypothetical protein